MGYRAGAELLGLLGDGPFAAVLLAPRRLVRARGLGLGGEGEGEGWVARGGGTPNPNPNRNPNPILDDLCGGQLHGRPAW